MAADVDVGSDDATSVTPAAAMESLATIETMAVASAREKRLMVPAMAATLMGRSYEPSSLSEAIGTGDVTMGKPWTKAAARAVMSMKVSISMVCGGRGR